MRKYEVSRYGNLLVVPTLPVTVGGTNLLLVDLVTLWLY